MVNECCENCKFAKDYGNDKQISSTTIPALSDWVKCRRFPPDGGHDFPTIPKYEWCGEFILRETVYYTQRDKVNE